MSAIRWAVRGFCLVLVALFAVGQRNHRDLVVTFNQDHVPEDGDGGVSRYTNEHSIAISKTRLWYGWERDWVFGADELSREGKPFTAVVSVSTNIDDQGHANVSLWRSMVDRFSYERSPWWERSTAFESTLDISAPSEVILLPAAFWLIVRVARLARKYWRRKNGRCEHCGYDLRASTERCPECGAKVPTDTMFAMKSRPAD